jgi:hypothetical protein
VAYFKGVFWSDLFQGIIPELAWRDWEKPWKLSFRVTSTPAKIQIKCPSDTSLECYHFTDWIVISLHKNLLFIKLFMFIKAAT